MPVQPNARCPVFPGPHFRPCPLHHQPRWHGLHSHGYRTRPGEKTSHWPKIRALVLRLSDHACVLCGSPATVVDHIRPRAIGGTDDLDNLQALCSPCSDTKTARDGLSRRKDRQR